MLPRLQGWWTAFSLLCEPLEGRRTTSLVHQGGDRLLVPPRADERRLIATANMHLPGRQVDPKQVRRDLWRLSQWERDRLRRAQRPEGSVPAP